MLLHKFNELSNDHIVNIEKKRATTRGSVDKESGIVGAGLPVSVTMEEKRSNQARGACLRL